MDKQKVKIPRALEHWTPERGDEVIEMGKRRAGFTVIAVYPGGRVDVRRVKTGALKTHDDINTFRQSYRPKGTNYGKGQAKDVGKFLKKSDLADHLPHGAITLIALELGLSFGYTSAVLGGAKRYDTTNGYKMINLAQPMAALEIWNKHFNKMVPNLDPLKARV